MTWRARNSSSSGGELALHFHPESPGLIGEPLLTWHAAPILEGATRASERPNGHGVFASA